MSVQVSSPYDGQQYRSHTQHINSSPIESPRIQRRASQGSILPSAGSYSPSIPHLEQYQPMSFLSGAHEQPIRPFQPTLSFPSPSLHFGHPSSASPLHSFGVNQQLIRPSTVSHAHPMNSATDQTTSTRWSSSPESATGIQVGPPTATLTGYQMHHFQPQTNYGLEYQDQNEGQKHINPMQILTSQSMSRSVSGGSDPTDVDGRLTTPVDYQHYQSQFASNDQELRKVSDTLIRNGKLYSQSFIPNFALSDHALSIQPHPQPEGVFFRGGSNDMFGTNFAVSSERNDAKPNINPFADTDYERDRAARIMQNKQTLENLGLDQSHYRVREMSAGRGPSRRATPIKKRLASMVNPVRASPRIASMHRGVSYAHLDGGDPGSEDDSGGEDQYQSEEGAGEEFMEDEDDFRPLKKVRGQKMGYRKKPRLPGHRSISGKKPLLSLWGLLQVYPEIPQRFPLFYYTLNNDLSINSDSVPLIGSIPSTITPLQKADTLRAFFHKAKRVLSQLDAFTQRCDRKWDGPELQWSELDHHHRIAVRDVRRKVVERCENYKYTRRDILDKMVGKNKWQPIEYGMIEWQAGVNANDPAGDLSHVTLTLPTPPPGVVIQQHQQQQQRQTSSADYQGRVIRPFPTRRAPSSAGPRTVSITMAEPDQHQQHPYTAGPQFTHYPYQIHGDQMYNGHQAPMSSIFSGGMTPIGSATGTSSGNPLVTPATAGLAEGNGAQWDGLQGYGKATTVERSMKRIREEEHSLSPTSVSSQGIDQDQGNATD